MSAQYFLQTGGKQYGPLSRENFDYIVAKAAPDPDAMYRKGTADFHPWLPVESLRKRAPKEDRPPIYSGEPASVGLNPKIGLILIAAFIGIVLLIPVARELNRKRFSSPPPVSVPANSLDLREGALRAIAAHVPDSQRFSIIKESPVWRSLSGDGYGMTFRYMITDGENVRVKTRNVLFDSAGNVVAAPESDGATLE